MESISGTYHDGQVKLDGSVQWPDGCRVNVSVSDPLATETIGGLDEHTWGDTAENRAWLIAQWEALEPPTMTDAEWAEWQAARKAIKEYTLQKMKQKPPPSDS